MDQQIQSQFSYPFAFEDASESVQTSIHNAIKLKNQGKYSRALLELRSAARDSSMSPKARAYIEYLRGELESRRKNYRSALTAYSNAIAQSQQFAKALAQNGRAICLYDSGERQLARSELEKAVDEYSSFPKAAGMLQSTLGRKFRDPDLLMKALEIQRKRGNANSPAYFDPVRHSDFVAIAETAHALANTLLAQDCVGDAESVVDSCSAFQKDLTEWSEPRAVEIASAKLLFAKGRSRLACRDARQAKECFLQNLATVRKFGNSDYETNCLAYLARVCLLQNDITQAIEYWQNALVLAELSGNVHQVRSLRVLSAIEEAINEPLITALLTSVEEANKSEDQFKIFAANYLQFEFYLGKADSSSALQGANRCIATAAESGDRVAELSWLANIAVGRAHLSDVNPRAAINAFVAAEKTASPAQLSFTLNLLAEGYLEVGDAEKAQDTLQELLRLYEEDALWDRAAQVLRKLMSFMLRKKQHREAILVTHDFAERYEEMGQVDLAARTAEHLVGRLWASWCDHRVLLDEISWAAELASRASRDDLYVEVNLVAVRVHRKAKRYGDADKTIQLCTDRIASAELPDELIADLANAIGKHGGGDAATAMLQRQLQNAKDRSAKRSLLLSLARRHAYLETPDFDAAENAIRQVQSMSSEDDALEESAALHDAVAFVATRRSIHVAKNDRTADSRKRADALRMRAIEAGRKSIEFRSRGRYHYARQRRADALMELGRNCASLANTAESYEEVQSYSNEAIDSYEKAIDLCLQKGFQKRMADASIWLSKELKRQKRYDEAERQLLSAIERTQTSALKKHAGNVLGHLYIELSRYGDARHTFESVASICSSVGWDRDALDAHSKVAKVLVDANQHRQALTKLQMIESLAEAQLESSLYSLKRSPNDYGLKRNYANARAARANIQFQKARVLRELLRPQEAAECAERACLELREIGRYDRAATLTNTLAIDLIESGDAKTAIKELNAAIEHADKSMKPRDQGQKKAMFLTTKAKAYSELRDFEQSVLHFTRSITKADATAERFNVDMSVTKGFTYLRWGESSLSQGNAEAAVVHLRYARELLGENKYHSVEVYPLLGRALFMLRDDDAERTLQFGLSVARETSHAKSECEILVLLSALRSQQGDSEEAKNMLRQAREIENEFSPIALVEKVLRLASG